MARQRGVLIPQLRKGVHPDVIDAALSVLLPVEELERAKAAGRRPSERLVHEYDDEYGGPVWYLP